MSDLPDVSSEFLESNLQLCQTMPKSRKGGAYSKHERSVRRKEVYRLYFDYGYSARKIAELMNISRNTINSDIDYWFSKSINPSDEIDPETTILLNLVKMEEQRTRIRKYLDDAATFEDKLSVERLLLDIDMKINNTYHRLGTSTQRIYDMVAKEATTTIQKYGLKSDLHPLISILPFSKKASEQISKIVKKERKKHK